MPRKPPVTANACGREKSCEMNSLGRLVSLLERVTSKPAASEIRNAGTCAHQAVADGELGEDLGRLGERHAGFEHADDQAADDIDERDHDAGDGVAADELAGTVHRAEEVGLLRDLLRGGAGPRARR